MKTLYLFLLIALLSLRAAAQLPPPPPVLTNGSGTSPRYPSLKNISDDDVFYDQGETISIALPKWMNRFRQLGAGEISSDATGGEYRWDLQEATITLTMYQAKGEAEFDSDAVQSAYESRVRAVLLKKLNAKFVSSRPLSLGVFKGLEIIFTMPSGEKGIWRGFAWTKQQYMLMAFLTLDNPGGEQLVSKALDSFRILTDADRAEALAKRIEKATPKDLPQSPKPLRAGSDARDDRLHGKVKYVLLEREVTEPTPQAKKSKSYEETFDIEGNRVKKVFFDYRNNPSLIEIYGYIDGARASMDGWVRQEYNPPPPAVPPPPPAGPQASGAKPMVRDPRYASKYTYSYDKKKRLLEEVIYDNAGEVRLRIVREYGENRIERTTFRKNGEISEKSVEITDKKGNVIEQMLKRENYPEGKTTYKYESFDSDGNWTKRTITGTYGRYDGTLGNLNYIEWRTITYF